MRMSLLYHALANAALSSRLITNSTASHASRFRHEPFQHSASKPVFRVLCIAFFIINILSLPDMDRSVRRFLDLEARQDDDNDTLDSEEEHELNSISLPPRPSSSAL